MGLLGAVLFLSAFSPVTDKRVDWAQDEAPVYVRVERTDGTTVDGEWIGSHVHDYWTMATPIDDILPAPKEVTQMLFRSDRASAEPANDRALLFVSSKTIRKLESLPMPPDAISYRNYLRKNGLVFRPDFIDDRGGARRVRIDSENFDPRDHLVESGEGLFAWDLYLTAKSNDAVYRGSGQKNADHYIWDAAVRLPMAVPRAVVAESVSHFPDAGPTEAPPRSREGKENYVIANVHGNFQVVVAHLRRNSVPKTVRVGAAIDADQIVGRVGNSGWSDVPHLHVALLWNDTVQTKRQWSVPVEFANVAVTRTRAKPSRAYPFHVPRRGEWIERSTGR